MRRSCYTSSRTFRVVSQGFWDLLEVLGEIVGRIHDPTTLGVSGSLCGGGRQVRVREVVRSGGFGGAPNADVTTFGARA